MSVQPPAPPRADSVGPNGGGMNVQQPQQRPAGGVDQGPQSQQQLNGIVSGNHIAMST